MNAQKIEKKYHLHEAKRVLDLVRHLAVLGALGRFGHEVHVPGVELVDVSEPAGREGPQEVDSLRYVRGNDDDDNKHDVDNDGRKEEEERKRNTSHATLHTSECEFLIASYDVTPQKPNGMINMNRKSVLQPRG